MDATDPSEEIDPAAIDRAARAIEAGGLVVYPTETVYGLGANALDPASVEGVFDVKGRAHTEPISLGVPSIQAAFEYTQPTARERAFAREFLPGPVTLLVNAGPTVPDVLTAGRDRVGIRIPDHRGAQALLEEAGPLTATSANPSGQPSMCRVAELNEEFRERVAVVLDGGETPGTESTVVNLEEGIVRRGARADAIEAWLAEER